MKGKILPKLLLANTRLVVGTYTAVTLPFYTLYQRPWRVLSEARKQRVTLQRSEDGSYYYWKRKGDPIVHPHGYHLLKTFKDLLSEMKKHEDPNQERLAYRQVFSEQPVLDKLGKPVLQDGKALVKMKLDDRYTWLKMPEILQRINDLGKGFQSFNVNYGDKVIIYADTRLEWLLTALSLFKINAIIVTLFSNLGREGLMHGMKQTQAKSVVTTIDLLPRIADFIDEIANVQTIFYMRHPFQKTQAPALPSFPERIKLVALDECEQTGHSRPDVPDVARHENETSLIMYTSGTTGTPKAVLFSQKQIHSAMITLTSNVADLAHERSRHIYASFLPLAHIMGYTFELTLFTSGVRIGYSSPHTLTDVGPAHLPGQPGDLRLLQPTVLVTVPLILDRIVKEIYLKLSTRSSALPDIFTYLMDYKTRWKQRGYDTPILNRIVCKRVQEQFGGKLEYVVSGGAPLSVKTEQIIRAALNVKMIQGYGATETSGGALGMMRQDLYCGRVGFPLEGVRVNLASWPEGNYTVDDKPNPRGEVLLGGDSIALGYYKLEQETKEAFHVDSEGVRWFHTGDIGEILPDGSMRIIDRKKDLAKLPSGEYISLGKIESTLKTTSLVENVCICITDRTNSIAALVTPSEKQLRVLATQLGKSSLTREQLCRDEEVKREVMKAILEVCQKEKFLRYEIPAAIHLCAEEWLPDNNLLTAAFKLKRQNVMQFYKKEIDDMFSKI